MPETTTAQTTDTQTTDAQTTIDTQTVLAWYEALPETPKQARETDLQAARWFLDQGFTLQEVLVALLLGSARRQRRDPHLPPLAPIASLSYFAPIVREVRSDQDWLDPGLMAYLYQAVFGVPPEPETWKDPAQALSGVAAVLPAA